MSFDLYFWRESESQGGKPADTLKLLECEKSISGIAEFERTKVIDSFMSRFPDLSAGAVDVIWEGAGSYFQLGFFNVSEIAVSGFYASCGWSLLDSADTMNLIIDAGGALGCAVYDPQEDVRFEQPEPKS